jgi:aminoglycoside phosphotransferase (APT) family kinase protein
MSFGTPRRSGADIAPALLAILRDRLEVPDLEYDEQPQTLADGVTARAYGFRLALPPDSRAAGALVCRLFVGDFGTGDQTLVERALHNALAQQGFSVPRALASGDETSALEAPFMVMERVEGQNAFGPVALALGLGTIALLFGYWLPLLLVVLAYWTIMTRILTRLHAVKGDSVVAELGESGVEAERLSTTMRIRDLQQKTESEEFAPLRPLAAWLAENEPAPRETPVICHGDFWLGNVMLSFGKRSISLLDWTQASVGYPEADLGWMANQHFSRLPLGGSIDERVRAVASELIRPLAFLLLGANVLAYRLVRPVDRGRLRYFRVFAAMRALAEVMAARVSFEASGGSAPPAILDAWGSARSVSLIVNKVRALTGIELEL